MEKYAVMATVAGVLDEATLKTLGNGFDGVVATVGQIVPLALTATVSVIALTAGVDFALKKIKGVLHKAS